MNIKPLRTGIAVGVAGLALIAFTACGNDDTDENPDNGGGGDATATTAPANGNGNGDGNGSDNGNSDAVTAVTIEMFDNYFEPADITVPVGETVTITVPNMGQAIHNLTFPEFEFGSDMIVAAGEESVFEVMFDESGTYEFQCDYHVPDMVGTITAE